jgi:TrmH family RNA methyltransferase
VKRVTSADNPGFKALRLLAHSARERRRQGRTVLDGSHLVQSYLERRGRPLQLVFSESGLDKREIRLVAEGHPDIPAMVLADVLFAAASPVETPTGLLAVIDIPAPALPGRIAGSCAVLDAIQDAGNVGSILRSAAAAGIGLVLMTTGCAQAWSPKVLRAAMGGHFGLDIVEHADVLRLLSGYPGQVIATGAASAESLFGADLSGPVAWLFGGEGEGLSAGMLAAAHRTLRIPMPGGAESLNVAAAAAVCLFEQVRQNGGAASR